MKPQFLIAAPHSGAGKTTITLGILRALKNQGFSVQPFKCGPDYLDPKLHAIAAKKESINLDQFMMDNAHINELYHHYTAKAEVAVIEGVMGLFDGAVKMEGSSAALAKLLDIPVILVINAKAMAYSAAALLLGFKTLCKDVHIAGVIFNFVATESHYRLLKEAAEDVGIMPLGYIPSNTAIQIPSRHLGLQTDAAINHDLIIEKAAAHIAGHINLELLLNLTRQDLPPGLPRQVKAPGNKRILIARDQAFNFIYTETITAFKTLGSVSYFSPLHDKTLVAADLIHLPGGYPELFLKELSANLEMREQLLSYCRKGGKIIAECGGMMYLGKAISDETDITYPMVGLLDVETGMAGKKLSMGYKVVTINGQQLRGHEFHYSQFVKAPEYDAKGITIANARNEPLSLPIFSSANLLASYFHFYFANNIASIEKLMFGQTESSDQSDV
jgi:cobyrinic acid a,c-diamide synthase